MYSPTPIGHWSFSDWLNNPIYHRMVVDLPQSRDLDRCEIQNLVREATTPAPAVGPDQASIEYMP